MSLKRIQAHGRDSMLPAIVFAALSLAAAFAVLHPQNAVGEVGLVFPPWMAEVEVHAAIAAAGGQFVGPGRWPNAIIAYAADAGFHDRVRAHGAWFAVAASALCATPQISELGGRRNDA